MKVREILKVKGDVLFTVTPETPIHEAVRNMAEKDIGSLVVMQRGKLVGMLTFREIIAALHNNQEAGLAGVVEQHMQQSPMIATLDMELAELCQRMLEHHGRYVPVIEADTLLGVISFYDVAKAVLEAQDFENKMLKAYIRDWPEQESGSNA